MTSRRAPCEFGGETIKPGERKTVDLPLSVLSNHTPVNLSVKVVNGRRAGPVFFISAAVHGDEIMGVEIIRRVLDRMIANGWRNLDDDAGLSKPEKLWITLRYGLL